MPRSSGSKAHSKTYHPKNVPTNQDYNPTRERHSVNKSQNDHLTDQDSPSDDRKQQLSTWPRSSHSRYNTETEDHDSMLSDDETPLVDDLKHDAPRHPDKSVQEEPDHQPEHRRGNQWNYLSWTVIVALFAILSLFTYLNYTDDRRVDGIIDALKAVCETTEPERMGKCFKELLSNRANSGTFQQYHLEELKEKVKNLEASLGYSDPDSGEFRDLSKRLEEVTKQQKETKSLLEKTKTEVSRKLDQHMVEINEWKTTVKRKLQADHDNLRNDVKERMDRQDNTKWSAVKSGHPQQRPKQCHGEDG